MTEHFTREEAVTEAEVCAALRTHGNAYKGTPDSAWGAEAKMFMQLVLDNFLRSRTTLSRTQAAPAVGVPDAAYKLGRNAGLEDAKRAVAALNCPQDENNFEAACMYAMHAIESLKDNTP